MIDELLRQFEAYLELMNTCGSGPFRGITTIDVKLNKSKNIYGSGSSFIELPDEIKAKKACININNQLSCKNGITLYDNKCFLWSLVASKHYDDIKKIESDRKSTRLNSSHLRLSRMPSSA